MHATSPPIVANEGSSALVLSVGAGKCLAAPVSASIAYKDIKAAESLIFYKKKK